MRLTTLALFLCAGTTAICQAPAPAPANPDKLWNLPPEFTQPGRHYLKPPEDWDSLKIVPRTTILAPKPAHRMNDARIDPKIIVHPPKSSLGEQPEGTLMAQNLYPNLRLLPIEWPLAEIEEIPIDWPMLKIQAIPLQHDGILQQASPRRR